MINFGIYVAKCAKKKGLKLREVAVSMGIDARSLSRYLQGHVEIPEIRALQLAGILGLDEYARNHLLILAELDHCSDRLRTWIETLQSRAALADACDQKLNRVEDFVRALRDRPTPPHMLPAIRTVEDESDEWLDDHSDPNLKPK